MTDFVFCNRVAVAGQQDADSSRGGQLARCLAYTEAHGWANIAVYADDAQGDAR